MRKVKSLTTQYPKSNLHIKIQIILFLHKKIGSKIRCKEIIDKLEVDKTYLSKILSTLVIKGFIKKKPVVRRIKKSECYFTIILKKKGIRYARSIISDIVEETIILENQLISSENLDLQSILELENKFKQRRIT